MWRERLKLQQWLGRPRPRSGLKRKCDGGSSFHIEGLLDAGERVPKAHGLAAFAGRLEYAGRTWAVVSVDLATLSGKSRRLNVSLPERVVRRIDAAAAKSGESRSGFLARVALDAV